MKSGNRQFRVYQRRERRNRRKTYVEDPYASRYAVENSAEMNVSMPDVDDQGRRTGAQGARFSRIFDVCGDETLFTSYASVGNSADWNPSVRFGCNVS